MRGSRKAEDFSFGILVPPLQIGPVEYRGAGLRFSGCVRTLRQTGGAVLALL